MRLLGAVALMLLCVSASAFAQTPSAQLKERCVTIDRAKAFIGQEVCVVGEVYRVGFSDTGTAFLSFCEDEKKCPFSVVVFGRDVGKVGNLQMFEGRELEVTGKVRVYEDKVEIVVKQRSQFSGEAMSPSLGRPDASPRSGRWHR